MMTTTLDLVQHLERQRAFSEAMFGPGRRTGTVTAHIRKELDEIMADPEALEEWIDVVLLALDGAWRTGATSAEIATALCAKQTKNEGRDWPDWRKVPDGEPVEHVKTDNERARVEREVERRVVLADRVTSLEAISIAIADALGMLYRADAILNKARQQAKEDAAR